MRTGEILTLFDYNYWANARILAAAAQAGEAPFTAPAQLSHGSLRGSLVHILNAEWIWRTRCQSGVSPAAPLAEEEFPTLAALRVRWQTEEGAMRSFLAGLRDDDLIGAVQYTTTRGKPFANILWHILAHVVNHGTQTRSEAALQLTGYGQSPGDLDLIIYLRERR